MSTNLPSSTLNPRPSSAATSFTDLVGGRVLAWVGGATTLLGVIFLLVLAVSRGWIGVDARMLMAAAGSAALLVAGAWLHDRRGRTEASLAMVGTGSAGLFATIVVAGQVYRLVSPELALVAALAVGAVTTTLAIRWAGKAIGLLGLVGALLSPVLVGAPVTALTIALLALAATGAVTVVAWQRWGWMALTALLVCAPQWVMFVERGAGSVDRALVVLSWFALLGLAGALGVARPERTGTSEVALIAGGTLAALSGCLTAAVGFVALTALGDQTVGELWLAGLATAHLAAGLVRVRGLEIPSGLRGLLVTLGVLAGDCAFALAAHGLVQSAGWAAAGIVFAWLVRRMLAAGEVSDTDRALLGAGLSGHVALTLLQAVLTLPPDRLASTNASGALMPAVVLAASCLICGELIGARGRLVRDLLNALGLLAIAYLTAGALQGPAEVATWALEGLSLVWIGRRRGDRLALGAGALFTGLAGLHTVVLDAPPSSLITGVSSPQALLAVLTMAVVALAMTRCVPGEWRPWLAGAAAAAAVYLVSVTITTIFQPAAGTMTDTILALSVRQEGQAVLSAWWALAGVLALILGLRANIALIRGIALTMLLASTIKVFLYDLATLTSIYRVASFIALGLLLLAGAFAYQRLRPPPLPDLRSVRRGQR